MLDDSFAYTKDARWGKWTRWITFVILSIPFTLFPIVFDTKKIMVGTTFHWELIHWDQVAIVLAVGILFSFFVSGYTVRIYRGTKPAPDFTEWGKLFIEGIKLDIVGLLWAIPILIALLVVLGVAFLAIASTGSTGSIVVFLGIMLIAIIIEFIACVFAILYGIMGSVRFSRMGSIREGIRFSKITEHIRTIGWGSYILALFLVLIVGLIFSGVSYFLALVPYAGWLIQAAITPFISIFIARYITLLYDQGIAQPVVSIE
jgi:hypothetical protein